MIKLRAGLSPQDMLAEIEAHGAAIVDTWCKDYALFEGELYELCLCALDSAHKDKHQPFLDRAKRHALKKISESMRILRTLCAKGCIEGEDLLVEITKRSMRRKTEFDFVLVDLARLYIHYCECKPEELNTLVSLVTIHEARDLYQYTCTCKVDTTMYEPMYEKYVGKFKYNEEPL